MDAIVIFSEKNCDKKLRMRLLKKSLKQIRLQDAFHVGNNETVTFKTSCRPDFQDKYVLMFAGMFLRVLLLFQIIPKWFAFFTYLIWINIFIIDLQLKLLRLKAISAAEVDICLNRDMVWNIWYHIPGLNEINFC